MCGLQLVNKAFVPALSAVLCLDFLSEGWKHTRAKAGVPPRDAFTDFCRQLGFGGWLLNTAGPLFCHRYLRICKHLFAQHHIAVYIVRPRVFYWAVKIVESVWGMTGRQSVVSCRVISDREMGGCFIFIRGMDWFVW